MLGLWCWGKTRLDFGLSGTTARLTSNSAGVLGLTTALQLARQGYKDVTIVAKYMPGDNHPEYTSIWAGDNWVP